MNSDHDSVAPRRGAWSLARQSPPFRALFAARVISHIGDSLELVALMIFVADRAGHALAVSLLLLAGELVPSLTGPLAGALGDRFHLRRLMVTCDLVQAGLVAAIAWLLPPLPALLGLVAVRSVAGRVFLPASRSAVAAIVAPADLPAANASLGFGTHGAEMLGPVLAAALLPLAGLRGVLIVDVGTFLLSAALLLRLPSLAPASQEDQEGTSLLAAARTGVAAIWGVPALRAVVLGFCAVVAFNAVDDVAVLMLARGPLGGSQATTAILLGAVGVGLFVGYPLIARFGTRASMMWLLISGCGLSSAGNLLTGLAGSVAAAFSVQTTRGLGIAAMDVGANTLLQRLAPPELRSRVFGNFQAAVGVAAALSTLGGGLLLDATSARVTLLVAGGGGILATLAIAGWERSSARSRP